MRRPRAIVPLLAALIGSLAATAPALAASKPTRPCATPEGYTVIARDSGVVVFDGEPHSELRSDYPEIYRYCLLSRGTRFPEFSQAYADASDLGTFSSLRLAGDYIAYSFVFTDSKFVPGVATFEVDAKTGQKLTVPDPLATAGGGAIGYSPGFFDSFVLSPSGALAGLAYTYSATEGGAVPQDEFVTAFRASTDRATVLAEGAPGTLGDVQIFGCSAGCTSAQTVVVGWTSSGTPHFAAD